MDSILVKFELLNLQLIKKQDLVDLKKYLHLIIGQRKKLT